MSTSVEVLTELGPVFCVPQIFIEFFSISVILLDFAVSGTSHSEVLGDLIQALGVGQNPPPAAFPDILP